MSEKPILFNTEMVKAIMEGRKTVTRRLIKPKSRKAAGFYVTFRESDNQFMGVYDYDENEISFESSQTPPYQVGDILYLRETWSTQYNGIDDDNGYGEYVYKADGIKLDNSEGISCSKWKPSIHMPKEAARIFLRVTNVRVERLQEITTEQILKEGVIQRFDNVNDRFTPDILRGGFIELWNSTIKKEDIESYSYKANPWVWVIEFERIEKGVEINV